MAHLPAHTVKIHRAEASPSLGLHSMNCNAHEDIICAQPHIESKFIYTLEPNYTPMRWGIFPPACTKRTAMGNILRAVCDGN